MPKVPKGPSTQALARFEEKFEKAYGAGTLIDRPTPEILPTGSLALDYALGVGGYVEGRLIEIWGPEGAGKTTLAMYAAAEAQKKYPDRLVAWFDVERTFDYGWAEAHGVDTSKTRLKVVRPDNSEEVADQMKDVVRSGLFSLVVLDSIGAMITTKEIEKAADEATVAANPKVVTRMVNIAIGFAEQTNTTVILVNQVRANISYGADTTTGGGWALKHATTMKLKVSRTGTVPFRAKVDGEDRIVGHEIKIYTERNKVAPAYRTATVVLFNQPSQTYGPLGIDHADEAVTLGLNLGIIEKSGGWYTPPGGEKVNGRSALVKQLRENPKIMAEVRKQVLASRAHEIDFSNDTIELEDMSGEGT